VKTMTVAEFKADFSSAVDEIRANNEVVVTYGRSRRPLGVFVSYNGHSAKKPKAGIRLGVLKDKGWSLSMENFVMTDEELLGL
jgi:hypothetical protein